VVGAAFRVSDIEAVRRALASSIVSSMRVPASRAGGSARLLVPPQATHGIWLGFSEQ
jgi:hypothetical protein